jgi:hypothetical protein
MDLVSKAGWLKLFIFVLIITVPVSIVNMFTFELASIVLFPFISMMKVEAYMLISENNELNNSNLIADSNEGIDQD